MREKLNNKPKTLLFGNLDTVARGGLADELYAIAANFEEVLLLAGAEPGKDYTYLDLLKLAQPFVLEMWKVNDKMTYAYPSKKII